MIGPRLLIYRKKNDILFICDFKGSIMNIFVVIAYSVSKMESLNQNEMDRNSKESSVLKLREFMTVEDRNLSYVTFSEVQ